MQPKKKTQRTQRAQSCKYNIYWNRVFFISVFSVRSLWLFFRLPIIYSKIFFSFKEILSSWSS